MPHPPQLALLLCRLTHVPLQFVGVATPQQLPFMQSPAQAVPLSHIPLVAQLTGVCPLQSRDDGTHSPVHWPAVQTKGHVSLETVKRSGPQVTLVFTVQ
jgi:hypothetical protein